MKPISGELKAAIEKHISIEYGNSYLYLFAYQWARANGWEGFAKKWKEDSIDEAKHAQSFAKYLAKRNADARMHPIELAEAPAGIPELAAFSAQLENDTEDSMAELVETANRVGDTAAAQWLSEKLMAQETERKQADDFAKQIHEAAAQTGALVILNRQIERKGW
jgi:ferritin